MGIQGLTKLLADQAPECMKEQKFEGYFGRKIAVDASMHIYQFMVVVGRQGDQLLTSEAGDVTSHLQGMFYRTARMLEAGIRPVFVFDGKPPELKRAQLDQRLERREGATEALKAAQEAGNTEEIEKYSKRTIKVTREHNEECKKLLRLMGVPVVDAATEAEAQCAALAKAGLVYGVATEDMDALTFGTPRLIRHLMAPATSAQAITEFDHSKVLAGLGLTNAQFIDFCILCGCDYAGTIRGIGPVRALKLIQEHGSIEALLGALDPAKYQPPDGWPYKEARDFFAAPEVNDPAALPPLKWSEPDEEGLIQYLVGEKSFNEARVRSTVAKIKAAKGKAAQGRIESFFKPSGTITSAKPA
eukprot:CAMPEP_0202882264 /NCGR_PEP_ID=MMETSP1391-20130828/37732_1 /ASSEMBLY_ACC=CAM_ASM_000867 /TAXON_ID=1034604 /ORGANISM="Chlamydomonas leiostraca, Strain SAG 11-49" /LENGTH=358 /DNA_ID=CAMNT_0049565087 /DNA_START=98 /DNA_END=1170 /DNA_ORIENTATION=-